MMMMMMMTTNNEDIKITNANQESDSGEKNGEHQYINRIFLEGPWKIINPLRKPVPDLRF